MSLADYGMLKIASTNLISARRRVREITLWFSKAIKEARTDLDNAKQAKRAAVQEANASIFTYQKGLTVDMQNALKNNNMVEYENCRSQLALKQEQSQFYLKQFDSYLEDTIHQLQDKYDELEADKKEELADANNDVTFWEQIHKDYQKSYSEGVKDTFGNQA